jgi:hypothetical protein
MKKDKPSKHRPIRTRNPVVREMVAKPNRNAGKHKPNNVRTKQVNITEE